MSYLSNHNGLLCVEDRILLHLLNYREITYQYNVPFELTSSGIAHAVGTNRSYILSVIKSMIEKGYIEEGNGRVKNGKRIRRFFLLKDKGRDYSNELKKRLSNLSIEILFPDGTTKVMKLNKIIPYFKKEKICPEITEMVLYKFIKNNGTVKIVNMNKYSNDQLIDESDGSPNVQNFFGREKEMILFKKRVEDENGQFFILIFGMAGIGKSTLAAKMSDPQS